jgi:hypothetical protein
MAHAQKPVEIIAGDLTEGFAFVLAERHVVFHRVTSTAAIPFRDVENRYLQGLTWLSRNGNQSSALEAVQGPTCGLSIKS